MGTYRDEHEKEAMVKDINCGLWSASRDAKTHKVIKRLQEGANPNTTSGSYYSTPLHEAANKGSVEVAELLLAAGANPDARDGTGNTPLQNAQNRNHTNMVALLQDKNAMKNLQAQGMEWVDNQPTSARAANTNRVREGLMRKLRFT